MRVRHIADTLQKDQFIAFGPLMEFVEDKRAQNKNKK